MTLQKTNDVGSVTSPTPKNISTDTTTNTNVTSTQELKPPIPNLIGLGVLFIATLLTIYAGYVHGNMHLLTTLKNAHP